MEDTPKLAAGCANRSFTLAVAKKFYLIGIAHFVEARCICYRLPVLSFTYNMRSVVSSLPFE
jgi:hypothetical protein